MNQSENLILMHRRDDTCISWMDGERSESKCIGVVLTYKICCILCLGCCFLCGGGENSHPLELVEFASSLRRVASFILNMIGSHVTRLNSRVTL